MLVVVKGGVGVEGLLVVWVLGVGVVIEAVLRCELLLLRDDLMLLVGWLIGELVLLVVR